jgi:hypothetical protein
MHLLFDLVNGNSSLPLVVNPYSMVILLDFVKLFPIDIAIKSIDKIIDYSIDSKGIQCLVEAGCIGYIIEQFYSILLTNNTSKYNDSNRNISNISNTNNTINNNNNNYNNNNGNNTTTDSIILLSKPIEKLLKVLFSRYIIIIIISISISIII